MTPPRRLHELVLGLRFGGYVVGGGVLIVAVILVLVGGALSSTSGTYLGTMSNSPVHNHIAGSILMWSGVGLAVLATGLLGLTVLARHSGRHR